MGTQERALTEQSRLIVARQVIRDIVEREVGGLWESYPEIGEHDWLAIVQIAIDKTEELAPSSDTYAAAYSRLEGRAVISSDDAELTPTT